MSSFLVTGASRGIGLSLVRHLAERPVSEVSKVFASARSRSDALESVISAAKGRVEYVELDVTSRDSAAAALVALRKALDGVALDVLINNAGVMPYTSGGIRDMLVPVLPCWGPLTSNVIGQVGPRRSLQDQRSWCSQRHASVSSAA